MILETSQKLVLVLIALVVILNDLAQVIIMKVGYINKHWKFLCQKWLKDSNECGNCICGLQPINSSFPLF